MEVHDISVCSTKLTLGEQETLLRYDAIEKKWYADTTVQKHITKLRKQGWHLEDECHYGMPDGPVTGARFSAPERAVSIRNANTGKRVLSEAHMAALRAANPRTARGPC